MDYADIASTVASEVSETFKEVYLMAVDQIGSSNVLTAQIMKTKKFRAAPDGLTFYARLETGGKVANVPDAVLLPSPSRPKGKKGKANLSHTYTVVAIGGQSIPLTQNNRNAFVSNLQEQYDDALNRVRTDIERQYNGDGQGILAVVLTIAGAPTYGLKDPFGVAGGGPGTMLMLEDMDVAFINPANGAERGRTTVNSVDVDNEEVTCATSVAGVAIGDYVVRCNDLSGTGSDAANNYGAEGQGILAVTASGDTFENIDGTAFRRWNGTRLDNSGTSRPVSEKLVAKLYALRAARSSGKKPTMDYTTRGLSLELQSQLAALRRFTGETRKLRGGYEGLVMMGNTVAEGDYCPKGHYFSLDLSAEGAGWVDLVQAGFVDLDGSKLHRVEGRHSFRADLWFPHGVLWFNRSSQAVLADLDDDDTLIR